MYMNDSEILGKFNRADDKKAIVQVLADLNGCNKDEMEKHLVSLGIPEDSLGKRKRGRKPKDMKVEEVSTETKESEGSKEEDNTSLIVEAFGEMPHLSAKEESQVDRALAIPMPVRSAIIMRADFLTSKIQELMEERSTLYDYLEGKMPV